MASDSQKNNKNKPSESEQDHSMTTAEAGRKGGEKVLQERGPEFYSEIGRQQGKENNPGNFANRPKEEVQEAGRKGGESRGRDNQNENQGDSDK